MRLRELPRRATNVTHESRLILVISGLASLKRTSIGLRRQSKG